MASRVLITGGSGFIGRRLVALLLERGDQVTVLSRHATAAQRVLPAAARVVDYQPLVEGPWLRELDGVDVVLSLAGEPLAGVRWTQSRKARFEASRVTANELLVAAIERLPQERRPKVVLGSSGVGYYGACEPSLELDETSPCGQSYLAGLAQRWEKAVLQAQQAVPRVAVLRFGMVLGRGGGGLDKMVFPFRLHLGGPVGSGTQVFSWIHLEDACRIVLTLIDHPDARGAFNVTAPNPVDINTFAASIGQVLHRGSSFRVPAGLLRVLLGEASELFLTGQRVLPRAIERLGYRFKYPELVPALEELLAPRALARRATA